MKLIDGDIQAGLITEYILKNKERFIEVLQKCDNDFLFALMMDYFEAQPGYDITLVQKAESEKSILSDIKKRKEWPHKPCINDEDGCEEWAGCPCVNYQAKSEDESEETQ